MHDGGEGDALLAVVSAEARTALLATARTHELAPGTVLFDVGHARDVFLVERGVVRVGWPLSANRRALGALFGAPTLLGSDVALAHQSCLYDVAAHTAVSVRVIDGGVFSTWIETYPAAMTALVGKSIAMQRLLLLRHRKAHDELASRVADLLLSYLVALGVTEDEPAWVALTNEQISRDLGVVLRSISTAVSGLVRAGLVRRAPRGLVILDRARLTVLAGSSGTFVPPP